MVAPVAENAPQDAAPLDVAANLAADVPPGPEGDLPHANGDDIGAQGPAAQPGQNVQRERGILKNDFLKFCAFFLH